MISAARSTDALEEVLPHQKEWVHPLALHEWKFYEDLEPSLRSCQKIAPDHTESSFNVSDFES